MIDAATRFHIQSKIAGSMFSEEEERLLDAIDKLCDENDNLRVSRQGFGATPRYGFIFDGKAYRSREISVRISNLPGLEYDLNDRMEHIDFCQKQLARDRRVIGQGIAGITKDCWDLQEIRDVLPDDMAELHPELEPLSRVTDQDQALAKVTNQQAQKNWAKACEVSHKYNALRYMF